MMFWLSTGVVCIMSMNILLHCGVFLRLVIGHVCKEREIINQVTYQTLLYLYDFKRMDV